MGIYDLISEALYEASEESGFYELGYSEKCNNFYDMYYDGRNELCEAFKRKLKDKLSNMTNGDAIKASFPYITVEDNCQTYYSVNIENISKDKALNTIGFRKDWWDAPYEGSEQK